MSYTCYLNEAEWPTPSTLKVEIQGQNETVTLLNEGEINFLKAPGLTELTTSFTLPMLGGTHAPDYYLDILEKLKTEKTAAQFILVRRAPNDSALYDTNIKVSVEDYSIEEDASDGLDVSVEVNMKQWRDYGTKVATVSESSDDGTQSVTVEEERDDSTAPTAKTHTVVKGDTLWALAAKYYGSGAQYMTIFNANTDKLSNPNVIQVGQVLTIP